MTEQDHLVEHLRGDERAAALDNAKTNLAPAQKREAPRAAFHFLDGGVLKVEVLGDSENILRASADRQA